MTVTVTAYQPENVTNTSANGGRMTTSPVALTANGAGNFPDVDSNDRTTGVLRIRKWFLKVLGATTAATKAVIAVKPTPGADTRSYMISGTQRDQQAAMGSRKYASGVLHTNVVATDTVLVVDFETGSAADTVVQAGDKIAIWNTTTKNIELVVSSVAWTGDQASITLSAGVLNDFSAGAYVGSCIVDTTNVNPRFDNVVKNFTGSTYNETTYPILLDRIATDEQTITLTFTSSTAFSVVSDKHGVLASGTVSSDYAPNNPAFSLPYFTLQAAGWGGTHTTGEIMQFQIHPAAVPIWLNYRVSAGAVAAVDELPLVVWLDSY